MSLLGQNGMRGEVSRGLTFVELFRDASAVARNGGIVGAGTPTFGNGYATFDGASYLDYAVGNTCIRAGACSLDVECTATSAAGLQYAVYMPGGLGVVIQGGNWRGVLEGVAYIGTGVPVVVGQRTRITVTCPVGPGTATLYVDGVNAGTRGATTLAAVPSLVRAGGIALGNPYFGQVHSIRLFSQELSPEEVLQYARGTLFDYRSRPTIYLPMTNACHTATATLDTSGNGRNGVFSAAAPTKLVNRHGYELPGVNQYFTSTLNGAFNTAEISFAIEFEADYALNDGAEHGFYDTVVGGSDRYYLIKGNTNDLWVALGSVVVIVPYATVLPYWYGKGRNTIVVSGKTGKWNAWLNGGRIISDNASAWAAGNPATCVVGAQTGGGTPHDGRITRFASYPQALTPIAVYDLLAQWQMRASEQ